jgi:formylglycine-generating enzyme required for sulfatase activity
MDLSTVSLGALLFSATIVLGGCGSNDDGSKNGGAGKASGGSASSNAGSSAGGSAATASEGFDCPAAAEPAELVPVPAGDFIMGCNTAVDDDCDDDELPMHTVSLSAFQIDRTEVTQAQFAACVADGACTVPSCDWNCDEPALPASCLTWAQASAYCSWAGKRLPTEAEWEKAARGDQGNKYPWGNDPPDCSRANMAGCGDRALPAGSLEAGASPYGALDMAGNLVELVADWYQADYYQSSPAADPHGPEDGTRYSGRGGGFKSATDYLRSSKRDWYDVTDTAASLGFRCAR